MVTPDLRCRVDPVALLKMRNAARSLSVLLHIHCSVSYIPHLLGIRSHCVLSHIRSDVCEVSVLSFFFILSSIKFPEIWAKHTFWFVLLFFSPPPNVFYSSGDFIRSLNLEFCGSFVSFRDGGLLFQTIRLKRQFWSRVARTAMTCYDLHNDAQDDHLCPYNKEQDGH